MKHLPIAAVLQGALAATALLVLACSDSGPPTSPQGEEQAGPDFEISDAVHEGNAGFYFLPPLVPNPSYSGTFDASLAPVVQICEWTGTGCLLPLLAEYTMTTGPGSETVRVGAGHYIVNWHTNEFSLDPTKTYRIEVEVGGSRIGYADVDVVSSGSELRNVETGEFVPLLDGRTLPIKFRIEDHLSILPTCPTSAIVFNQGEPSAGILAVCAEGGAVTVLVDDPNDWETAPACSPDGLMIAYSAAQGYLRFLDANLGTATSIATGGSVARDPAWSPDGRRIAYAGPDGITVMDVDGSNKTVLGPGTGSEPAWSPDGARIAFKQQVDDDPAGEIFVMDADGSNQTRLTYHAGRDEGPDWSPDGTRLAFSSSNRVSVMDADGSNVADLGPGRFPSWSPDGGKIAFSGRGAQTGSYSDINVMNADGSNVTQITENYWWGFRPDWCPAAP